MSYELTQDQQKVKELIEKLLAPRNPIMYKETLSILEPYLQRDPEIVMQPGMEDVKEFCWLPPKTIRAINCRAAALIYLDILRRGLKNVVTSQRHALLKGLVENIQKFLREGSLRLEDIGTTAEEMEDLVSIEG